MELVSMSAFLQLCLHFSGCPIATGTRGQRPISLLPQEPSGKTQRGMGYFPAVVMRVMRSPYFSSRGNGGLPDPAEVSQLQIQGALGKWRGINAAKSIPTDSLSCSPSLSSSVGRKQSTLGFWRTITPYTSWRQLGVNHILRVPHSNSTVLENFGDVASASRGKYTCMAYSLKRFKAVGSDSSEIFVCTPWLLQRSN